MVRHMEHCFFETCRVLKVNNAPKISTSIDIVIIKHNGHRHILKILQLHERRIEKIESDSKKICSDCQINILEEKFRLAPRNAGVSLSLNEEEIYRLYHEAQDKKKQDILGFLKELKEQLGKI